MMDPFDGNGLVTLKSLAWKKPTMQKGLDRTAGVE